jgi:hypothetical protein
MLTAWLDSWSGAREVIDAMNGHGYNVRLSQSPFGWWAEFCRSQVSPLPKWIGQGHDTTTPGRAVRYAGAGYAATGRERLTCSGQTAPAAGGGGAGAQRLIPPMGTLVNGTLSGDPRRPPRGGTVVRSRLDQPYPKRGPARQSAR